MHGTINDVAVMGARPLYLRRLHPRGRLPAADLARIVGVDGQNRRGRRRAGGHRRHQGGRAGKGDGVFITTTGVGVLPEGVALSGDRARPGDVILLSGTLGDHGMAIMAQRESLGFSAPILSDTAALHGLIAAMLATGADIRCLRDPTRGGLATTLNEIARQSGVGMMLDEAGDSGEPAKWRRPASSSASTRSTSPTRASWSPSSPRPTPTGCWRRCARIRKARATAKIGTVHRRRPPLRADDDGLRRPAHRRLADRRAAAADLLSTEADAHPCSSPTASTA